MGDDWLRAMSKETWPATYYYGTTAQIGCLMQTCVRRTASNSHERLIGPHQHFFTLSGVIVTDKVRIIYLND